MITTTLRLCVFATLCTFVLAAAQDDTTATHKRSRSRSVIKRDLDKFQTLLDDFTVHNVMEDVRQWNRLEKLLGKQLDGTLTQEEQASLERLESFSDRSSAKEEQASPERSAASTELEAMEQLAERLEQQEPVSCKSCEKANAMFGRKCKRHGGGRRLVSSSVVHAKKPPMKTRAPKEIFETIKGVIATMRTFENLKKPGMSPLRSGTTDRLLEHWEKYGLCPTCLGNGDADVVIPIQAGFGSDCPTCIAEVIQDFLPCAACSGTGRRAEQVKDQQFYSDFEKFLIDLMKMKEKVIPPSESQPTTSSPGQYIRFLKQEHPKILDTFHFPSNADTKLWCIARYRGLWAQMEYTFDEKPLGLSIDVVDNKVIVTKVRNSALSEYWGIVPGSQLLSVDDLRWDVTDPLAFTKTSVTQYVKNAQLPIKMSFKCPLTGERMW